MRILLLGLIVIVFTDTAFCLNPSLLITQYVHTRWRTIDGNPLDGIIAIAQTTDGYLWLATDRGLMRFDGLHVTVWKPAAGEDLPANRITTLCASADGALWIATTSGLSRLSHGRLTNYTARDGLPESGAIIALTEDRGGGMWFGSVRSNGNGLGVIRNGTVRIYDAGLPSQWVLSLAHSSSGDLWVGTTRGLCQWTSGAAGPCFLTDPPSGISAMQEDAAGRLLFIEGTSIRRLANHRLEYRLGLETLPPTRIQVDRDNNVWLGTLGQGLVRLYNGHVERFTRRDGLSNDAIGSLYEDRQGNLWVGTAGGLDRFREANVSLLSTVEGLSGNFTTAVLGTRDGATWVGTTGGGLNRVERGRITRYSTNSGLPGTSVFSLEQDAAGRLWAGTTHGLARLSGERFIPVQAADGSAFEKVVAIAHGPDDTVWIADEEKGLVRIRNNRPETTPPGISLPGKDIYQLYCDRSGVLWAGYFHGGVSRWDGKAAHSFSAADGLSPGPVQSFYEEPGGTIWVGTGEGLSRFRDGRWTTWNARNGLPAGGVQGIAGEDRRLWLATAVGVLRLDKPETNRGELAFSTYGPSDAVRFPNARHLSNPRMTRSADGHIWISTESGVAVIDPVRAARVTPAPQVRIEQILVDGKSLDPSGDLAFRGRETRIQYTALSFAAPEMIRFRHRLDGVDHNWVDDGTAREIVFGHLPPGHYRFHVTATDENGVWNPEEASVSFHQEPAFYQTWYFTALCGGTLMAMIWLLHWLRVRAIQSRFQLVLRERARLTRELHDTLLQGFAGVVYQLTAASSQLETAPEAGKQRLQRALDQADQSLREAREALSSLRIAALENNTLPEALSAAAKQILDGTSIHFDLKVTGRLRELPYEAQANLFIIAREAMTNAMSHGRPSHLLLELNYRAREVRLLVQDDGIGFDPNQAAKVNHWGLSGIRERARQIAANANIQSAPGQGCRIEVAVPHKAQE